MSFFKKLTKQVLSFAPRDFAREAKPYLETAPGVFKREAQEIFDPRKIGRNLRVARWLWSGGRSPLEPKSPLEQARSDYEGGRVSTPDQARAVIDRLVGFEPGDIAQAQAITRLRDEGGLTRIVDLAFPAPVGELSTPFSSTGQARFAVGDLREFRDPYTI